MSATAKIRNLNPCSALLDLLVFIGWNGVDDPQQHYPDDSGLNQHHIQDRQNRLVEKNPISFWVISAGRRCPSHPQLDSPAVLAKTRKSTLLLPNQEARAAHHSHIVGTTLCFSLYAGLPDSGSPALACPSDLPKL
jgi:hypothetical protein